MLTLLARGVANLPSRWEILQVQPNPSQGEVPTPKEGAWLISSLGLVDKVTPSAPPGLACNGNMVTGNYGLTGALSTSSSSLCFDCSSLESSTSGSLGSPQGAAQRGLDPVAASLHSIKALQRANSPCCIELQLCSLPWY